MNRHLVIGGGLIGSHVALELADRGGEVAVLSRSFSDLLGPAGGREGIRVVQGDVQEAEELAGLVQWADTVFFLAGTSTPALSDTDAASSIAALLEPALHVFDAIRKSGPSRLILASSGGTVYGRSSELPTDEAAPIAPISVHGVNSWATEQYASLYSREHGIPTTVLRFANVYGPGQRPRGGFGVIAAWCEAAARAEPLLLIGDGSVRRDFVHARDAARAAVLAASSEPSEVLNVGSGRSISLLELIELLSEIVGRRLGVQTSPPRSIDVPVTELDSSALTALTGWRPEIELRDGIAECWEWANKQLVPGA